MPLTNIIFHPDPAIREAANAVISAQKALVTAVREHFPVGTECVYKRSPTTARVQVYVYSHGQETMLHVHNRDTNTRYKVDAASGRIHKVMR